jgi:hypothetical protein
MNAISASEVIKLEWNSKMIINDMPLISEEGSYGLSNGIITAFTWKIWKQKKIWMGL